MRTIRLKEVRQNVDDFLSPTESYRDRCDESLPVGPFRRRGTPDGFLATGGDRLNAEKKLILLGGSFVESMYIPEEARFAAVIERALPVDWRVCNGEYSGMTTLHLLLGLASKIPPMLTTGSKVIIFIGMSDLFALSQPGRYWDAHPMVTPIQPAPDSEVQAPLSIEPALRGVVRATFATAEALGMDFGVVASPYRDVGAPADNAESPEAIRRLIQAVAQEEAVRMAVPFLNSQDHVEPADFYDRMHLNEAGQARYASVLLWWIRSQLGV